MSALTTDAGRAALDRAMVAGLRNPGSRGGVGFTDILAIEAEAREGYVPASLSPEWHAELTLSDAEGYARALDDVRAAVEGLRVRANVRGEATWELGFRQSRNETVDAVLAAIERLRVTP